MSKIEVKEAVKHAMGYFRSFSSPSATLTVEEIEFDDAENLWIITLGISEENPYRIGAIQQKVDKFKTFKVDAETGEVKSMKIRTI